MYKLVFRNTAFVAIAEVLNKASSFATTILLARYLGAEDFGRFSFVLSVVGLLYIVADFGLSTLVVREMAQNKDRTKDYVEHLLAIKSLSALAIVAGAWLIVSGMKNDDLINQISIPLSISMAVSGLTQIAYIVFRAHERMRFESLSKLMAALTTALIVIGLILARQSLLTISVGFAAANIIVLVFAAILTSRNFAVFKPRFDRPAIRILFTLSWPFALGTLFASIYRYIDSVMLGYYTGVHEIGLYSASYRLVDAVALGAALFGSALYPTLSRLVEEKSPDRFAQLLKGAFKVIGWGIIPIVGLTFAFSHQLIAFIYGKDYLPGADTLRLLIWTAAITYITMVVTKALQAKHQVWLPVWAAGSGALLNIALNLWLIPTFGIMGAAISTLAAYVLVLAIQLVVANQVLDIRPLVYFAKPMTAIIPAVYVASLPWMQAAGVFPSLPIAITVYVVGIILLKGITIRDIIRLREIILGKDV